MSKILSIVSWNTLLCVISISLLAIDYDLSEFVLVVLVQFTWIALKRINAIHLDFPTEDWCNNAFMQCWCMISFTLLFNLVSKILISKNILNFEYNLMW